MKLIYVLLLPVLVEGAHKPGAVAATQLRAEGGKGGSDSPGFFHWLYSSIEWLEASLGVSQQNDGRKYTLHAHKGVANHLLGANDSTTTVTATTTRTTTSTTVNTTTTRTTTSTTVTTVTTTTPAIVKIEFFGRMYDSDTENATSILLPVLVPFVTAGLATVSFNFVPGTLNSSALATESIADLCGNSTNSSASNSTSLACLAQVQSLCDYQAASQDWQVTSQIGGVGQHLQNFLKCTWTRLVRVDYNMRNAEVGTTENYNYCGGTRYASQVSSCVGSGGDPKRYETTLGGGLLRTSYQRAANLSIARPFALMINSRSVCNVTDGNWSQCGWECGHGAQTITGSNGTQVNFTRIASEAWTVCARRWICRYIEQWQWTSSLCGWSEQGWHNPADGKPRGYIPAKWPKPPPMPTTTTTSTTMMNCSVTAAQTCGNVTTCGTNSTNSTNGTNVASCTTNYICTNVTICTIGTPDGGSGMTYCTNITNGTNGTNSTNGSNATNGTSGLTCIYVNVSKSTNGTNTSNGTNGTNATKATNATNGTNAR